MGLYNPAQMEQQGYEPQLIRSRRIALVGLILTGYIAVLTFRAAFLQSPNHSHWLLPLDNVLPAWALWAVNVAFYGYLLWLCFTFFRAVRGKERVLIAGWVPGIVLSPIQSLVSISLADAIQYVKAVSISVAFVAAILILIEGPGRPQSE
jgi:uncharacterized membrane protein YkvI